MKMWFFKGQGNWYSLIIRLITRSPYSHCQLELSTGDGYSTDAVTDGMIYLSKEEMENLVTNSNDWDCIVLDDIPEEVELKIIEFCKEEVGCKYDYLGVIMGWINKKYHHPDKWFCSELCRDVTRLHRPDIGTDWYTPGSLFDKLIEYGYMVRPKV